MYMESSLVKRKKQCPDCFSQADGDGWYDTITPDTILESFQLIVLYVKRTNLARSQSNMRERPQRDFHLS